MDLVVAFGVIPKASISRNGYMVRGAGNPPDFELQVVPDILQGLDLDFTQNPGKVMDDITFVRSHWWLVSEGFSLSTANSDVQKLPATLYHRIADSLAYAA